MRLQTFFLLIIFSMCYCAKGIPNYNSDKEGFCRETYLKGLEQNKEYFPKSTVRRRADSECLSASMCRSANRIADVGLEVAVINTFSPWKDFVEVYSDGRILCLPASAFDVLPKIIVLHLSNTESTSRYILFENLRYILISDSIAEAGILDEPEVPEAIGQYNRDASKIVLCEEINFFRRPRTGPISSRCISFRKISGSNWQDEKGYRYTMSGDR